MAATEEKELRKKTKKYIDRADERMLRIVHAMLAAEIAFMAEMDKRTKEYESGTAKLFTTEEMENNARKSYKAHKK